MKIIHIAGWSGSGKTTFILDLVAALSALGPVGTIKHIGEHIYDLPAGKDTTRHYDAGAIISAGIDLEKTMITSRSISLPQALDMLSDVGVRYAVVEGFKSAPFRKVVIGDLDTPALARDPSVSEVIALLPECDEYYTLSGLMREIEGEPGSGILYSMTGEVPVPLSRDRCTGLEEEISHLKGVISAKVRCNGSIGEDLVRFFILVRADIPSAGILALDRCGQELSVDCQGALIPGRGTFSAI